MRVGLLYIGVLLVILSSCQKNHPGDILPPPTNSGEHTLGFFVNGEAWIPYDRGSHERYELPKAKITDDGGLKISATRIDDKLSCRQWFCIEITDSYEGIGKYELSSLDCISPFQTFFYGSKGDQPSKIYEIDSSKPHYIEITRFDEDKKFVSGLFEFDAVSDNSESLHITSGRFDLNFE